MRWEATKLKLPADGQRVDFLTASGVEVTGGRYRAFDGWLVPPHFEPTDERVIGWRGAPTLPPDKPEGFLGQGECI
jgi:hypothetical protein